MERKGQRLGIEWVPFAYCFVPLSLALHQLFPRLFMPPLFCFYYTVSKSIPFLHESGPCCFPGLSHGLIDGFDCGSYCIYGVVDVATGSFENGVGIDIHGIDDD